MKRAEAELLRNGAKVSFKNGPYKINGTVVTVTKDKNGPWIHIAWQEKYGAPRASQKRPQSVTLEE